MIDLLALMRDHDLYREPNMYGYLCDCMHHYCDCEHDGFRAAYNLIADALKEESGR